MSAETRSEQALGWLRTSIESDRLGQAYVVVGDPKTDAGDFATTVLQLLFCRSLARPCGECRVCLQVADHTHPNTLWVEPHKKARNIDVDSIRALQRRVHQTSFDGGWKAGILVDADRLNDAAANAFLKTLEEPPPKTLFLLLTASPMTLLPTIQSRCQRVLLSGAQPGLRLAWEEAVLEHLARAPGHGEIGGLALADRMAALLKEIETTIIAEEKETVDPGVSEEDIDEVIDARVNARVNEARSGILRTILGWHRDILMLVGGIDAEELDFPAFSDELRAQAEGLDLAQALRNLRTVETMGRQIARNVQSAAAFEFGFGRIAG